MALQHLESALFLIAATILLHGSGTLLICWLLFRGRIFSFRHFGYIQNAALLTMLVVALLVVHLVEVLCWAGFYWYKACFSNFDTSVYFSLVTYTTLGYGDVVVGNAEWRLLGGVEALMGSLMLCWSTVILVPVITKIYSHQLELWEDRLREAGDRIGNEKKPTVRQTGPERAFPVRASDETRARVRQLLSIGAKVLASLSVKLVSRGAERL